MNFYLELSPFTFPPTSPGDISGQYQQVDRSLKRTVDLKNLISVGLAYCGLALKIAEYAHLVIETAKMHSFPNPNCYRFFNYRDHSPDLRTLLSQLFVVKDYGFPDFESELKKYLPEALAILDSLPVVTSQYPSDNIERNFLPSSAKFSQNKPLSTENLSSLIKAISDFQNYLEEWQQYTSIALNIIEMHCLTLDFFARLRASHSNMTRESLEDLRKLERDFHTLLPSQVIALTKFNRDQFPPLEELIAPSIQITTSRFWKIISFLTKRVKRQKLRTCRLMTPLDLKRLFPSEFPVHYKLKKKPLKIVPYKHNQAYLEIMRSFRETHIEASLFRLICTVVNQALSGEFQRKQFPICTTRHPQKIRYWHYGPEEKVTEEWSLNQLEFRFHRTISGELIVIFPDFKEIECSGTYKKYYNTLTLSIIDNPKGKPKIKNVPSLLAIVDKESNVKVCLRGLNHFKEFHSGIPEDQRLDYVIPPEIITYRFDRLEILLDRLSSDLWYALNQGRVPLDNSMTSFVKIDLTQMLKFFKNICRGISRMNKKGYAHGDIKESNILLDGLITKITDFDFFVPFGWVIPSKVSYFSRLQSLGVVSPETEAFQLLYMMAWRIFPDDWSKFAQNRALILTQDYQVPIFNLLRRKVLSVCDELFQVTEIKEKVCSISSTDPSANDQLQDLIIALLQKEIDDPRLVIKLKECTVYYWIHYLVQIVQIIDNKLEIFMQDYLANLRNDRSNNALIVNVIDQFCENLRDEEPLVEGLHLVPEVIESFIEKCLNYLENNATA